MSKVRRQFRERFEEKYIPEPMSGCWLWIGGTNEHGYGIIGLGKRGFGNIKAHRASWKLYVGELAEDIDVCHKCDNPYCVNPQHLFLGTHKINMSDMCKKGRHPNTKKTHCVRGHFFDEKNTKINSASGSRVCVTCSKEYKKLWHIKNKKSLLLS